MGSSTALLEEGFGQKSRLLDGAVADRCHRIGRGPYYAHAEADLVNQPGLVMKDSRQGHLLEGRIARYFVHGLDGWQHQPISKLIPPRKGGPSFLAITRNGLGRRL